MNDAHAPWEALIDAFTWQEWTLIGISVFLIVVAIIGTYVFIVSLFD